ncbi:hypothetical protein CPB86DRAFT_823407 [Serendipita vermifera]|nr:hypothetical protein CPB86DRAFT_823407 [Serendipita vermifera]
MYNSDSRKRSWEIASSNGPDEDPASAKKPRYDTAESAEGFSDIYRAINLASATAHQEILARLPAGAIFELARMCLSQGRDPNELDPNWLCRLQATHRNSLALIAKHSSIGHQSQAAYDKVAESLDWEANAMVKGDGTMLECQPPPASLLEEELTPRSGRVVFSANLNVHALAKAFLSNAANLSQTNSSNPPEFQEFFTLKPLRLGDSSLFTRVFGSHRFLRVSLTDRTKWIKELAPQQKAKILMHWLKRPLNIFGRIFRAFAIKDDIVWYFMEGEDKLGSVAETWNGRSPGQYGSGLIVDSIEKLVNWWIPLEENGNQLICKLVSRFHLGISSTVPGLLLHEKDEVEWTHDIKRNGVVFTDGCGLISEKCAEKHRRKCAAHHLTTPAAYQIRISTAKGVVQKVPGEIAHNMEGKSMWITNSMVKAKQLPRSFAQPGSGPPLLNGFHILDAAHMVTCIVKASKWTFPSRLSSQLIPILVNQGVHKTTIQKLQQAELEVIFKGLMEPLCRSTSMSETERLSFAKAIQKHGNLIYKSLVEDQASDGSPHLPRMRNKAKNVEDINLDDIIALTPEEEADFEVADLAFCQSQQLYLAVIAGLDVLGFEYFTKLWKKIINHCAMNSILSFHVEVKESAYCMILPDFSGKVPEGYISFTPPEPVYDSDGVPVEFISGEVLVARHPALLVTDIRKVHLTYIPSLRSRPGVIFFSTLGERPLADILGGGDYDGDTVILIWNKEMVDQFSNADLRHSEAPLSVSASFKKDETRAESVINALQRAPKGDRLSILQDYLLASAKVDSNLLGKYSRMHIKAVQWFGIESEEARCMAHKFMTVMDAAKSALQLTESAKIADGKKYDCYEDPLWKREKDAYFYNKKKIAYNTYVLPNGKQNVLNELWHDGKLKFEAVFDNLWNEALAKGKVVYNASQHAKLLLPVEKASKLAEQFPTTHGKQWNAVKEAVHQVYNDFAKWNTQESDKEKEKDRKERRKELIRLLKRFSSTPLVSEVEDLVGGDQDVLDSMRASYAFFYDTAKNKRGNKGGFPWLMSFGTLIYLLNSNRRTALPIPISTLKRYNSAGDTWSMLDMFFP